MKKENVPRSILDAFKIERLISTNKISRSQKIPLHFETVAGQKIKLDIMQVKSTKR